MTPIPAAAMPLPTYEQSEKFEVGVVFGRGLLLWIYVCRRMGCLILLIVLRVQWGLWHSVRIKGRLDQLVNLLYSFLVWNSLSLSLSLSLFLSTLCLFFLHVSFSSLLSGFRIFFLIFIVCFFFSWLGYLLSCCLATTLAAQSGAAAGLGLSLVFKTIFVEVGVGKWQINS